MYDGLASRYYDRLYEGKDYAAEVDYVIRRYHVLAPPGLPRVLDVGCGTGNHAYLMARRGCPVVGVDRSAPMIERARLKNSAGLPVEFCLGDLADLAQGDFDLAISMFNVVNHIHSLAELLAFFRAIRARLRPAGVFVFDCLNGVAAIRNPARATSRQVKSADGSVFQVEVEPDSDFMRLQMRVLHRVQVTEPNLAPLAYSAEYLQTLWPPKIFLDLLEMADFKVLSVDKLFQFEAPPTEDDWRIVITAQCQQPGRGEAIDEASGLTLQNQR